MECRYILLLKRMSVRTSNSTCLTSCLCLGEIECWAGSEEEALSLMQDVCFWFLLFWFWAAWRSYQEEPVLRVLGYLAFRELYGALTLEHQSLYLLQPACSSVMDANTPETGTLDHLTSQLLYGSYGVLYKARLTCFWFTVISWVESCSSSGMIHKLWCLGSMWDRVTYQLCKHYGSVPLQTFDLNRPQSGSMLSDERPQFSQLGGFP